MNKLTVFKCNAGGNMPVPFLLHRNYNASLLLIQLANSCDFFLRQSLFNFSCVLNRSAWMFVRVQTRVSSAPGKNVERFIVLTANFQQRWFQQRLSREQSGCGKPRLALFKHRRRKASMGLDLNRAWRCFPDVIFCPGYCCFMLV